MISAFRIPKRMPSCEGSPLHTKLLLSSSHIDKAVARVATLLFLGCPHPAGLQHDPLF